MAGALRTGTHYNSSSDCEEGIAQLRTMLHFGELLNAQVEDEVPYSSLKSLLRALNSNHPHSSKTTAEFLSQTQTPGQSQSSAPLSTPFHTTDDALASISVLQPKSLHSSFDEAAKPSARAVDISLHPADGDDWAEHVASSFRHDLSKATEKIKGGGGLKTGDVGEAINGVVQFLAERIHESGDDGDVCFSHVRAVFAELNSPLFDFFQAASGSEFQPADVVSSVRNEKGGRSTVVFYSSGFWASLYAEYMSGNT